MDGVRVEDHIGLARMLAGRYTRRFGGDLEEHTASAYYGLVRAARDFNPRLGYRFSTYAGKVIWRHIYTDRNRARGRTGLGKRPDGQVSVRPLDAAEHVGETRDPGRRLEARESYRDLRDALNGMGDFYEHAARVGKSRAAAEIGLGRASKHTLQANRAAQLAAVIVELDGQV